MFIILLLSTPLYKCEARLREVKDHVPKVT